MGNHGFKLDTRLGIELPILNTDWETLTVAERSAILEHWETVRGTIPDRIFALERTINKLQDRLNEEEDFEASCRLNSDIAEQASRINDLHIWYRVNQEIDTRRHSG